MSTPEQAGDQRDTVQVLSLYLEFAKLSDHLAAPGARRARRHQNKREANATQYMFSVTRAILLYLCSKHKHPAPWAKCGTNATTDSCVL